VLNVQEQVHDTPAQSREWAKDLRTNGGGAKNGKVSTRVEPFEVGAQPSRAI
jgi:hypothetical protein